MKKIIQRSLPTDVTYELIESFYSPLIDGGTCCENCGRPISNIAKVKSKYGTFYVGMDCAETLGGIGNSLNFEYVHKARFAQAKQAVSRINKLIKDGYTDLKLKTFDNDNNFYKEIGSGWWHMNKNGAGIWKQYPEDTWGRYVLPMIKNLVK